MAKSSKWRTDILFYLRQILANFNYPLKKIGRVLKLGKQNTWDDIQTIFIISTGRTGTHFLSHFFQNNFEKTYGVHEDKWDPYELNIRYVRGKIGDYQAMAGLDLYRQKQRRMLRREGYEVFVESNHNYAYLIPILRKYFKNYKILHIVRDGKESVRSYYAKTSGGKRVEVAHILAEDDVRRRLSAPWFRDDPFRNDWKNWDRFRKVCWYWAGKDGRIQDAIKGDPNALSVKFEDILGANQTEAKWQEIIRFLGMDERKKPDADLMEYIRSSRSNQTKVQAVGSYDEWTDEQKAAFKQICGPHMERCGYPI